MNKKDIPEHLKARFEHLGRFIHELRLCNGLSQEELSERSGLHRNSIIRSEGSCNMTLISLFELADALNVSPSDLIHDCQ